MSDDFIATIRAKLASRIRELAQDEDRAGLPATAAVYRECAAEVERPTRGVLRRLHDLLTAPLGRLPSGIAPEDVLADRIDEAVALIHRTAASGGES